MMKWLNNQIAKYELKYAAQLRYARKITLPGFGGVPLYDVLKFLYKELQNNNLTNRAGAISYYWLLALFPSIIFLFTLLPLLPIAGLEKELFRYMDDVLPHAAFGFIRETIDDLFQEHHTSWLSIGFVTAFIASTNGINVIISTFYKRNDVFRKRNWLQQKWLAIKLTFVLFLLLVTSITLVITGQELINWLAREWDILHNSGILLLNILRWLILLGMFYTSITIIYRYGPNTKKKWGWISPGSTLSSVLSVVASLFFTTYVNNFGLYNGLYGSIGALIAVMLWFYVNAFVLLVGFELNASITYKKHEKRLRLQDLFISDEDVELDEVD